MVRSIVASNAKRNVTDPALTRTLVSVDPHAYLAVRMPDWFVLEFQRLDGTWMDEAFCTPQGLVVTYLCSDGGTGLWIRAVAVDADGVIDHVDGGGKHHRYRLLAPSHERYPTLKSRADLPF